MFLIVANFCFRRPLSRNHSNTRGLVVELLERVHHKHILTMRILSHGNPPDFGDAVLIVRNRDSRGSRKTSAARSKSTPCLLKLVLALSGSHSNSYRNAAIAALHFSLKGDRSRETARCWGKRGKVPSGLAHRNK